MTRERLARIEELYHAAHEREPGAQGAFLAQACGSDQELRREVESLLAHDDVSGPMMQPVLEIGALDQWTSLECCRIFGRSGIRSPNPLSCLSG
jgi:hypothetical protein